MYADAEVRRLYRICLLRRLGMPLEEIGRAVDEPGWDLEPALQRHLELLDKRLDAMEEMVMLDNAVQHRVSILVYEDIAAAYAYLVHVFGSARGT